MGVLAGIVGTGGKARTLSTVASFGAAVIPHTDKAGEDSYGFKVFPLLASGEEGRFSTQWIRVTAAGDVDKIELGTLDAYLDSLDVILQAGLAFRAACEAKGLVTPRKSAAPPAPKAPPAPPAPPAKKASVLDSIIGDLPA